MNTVTQILDSLDEAARADRTDGQLLDLFVRLRDQDAFAAVVRRHGPMVLGVCRRVLRNAADADDAFQAAFLVLARKAATISTRHLLAQWLYGVAFNTARKLRQSNTRRAGRERPLAEVAEPCANATDGRDELLAILDEELNQLPDRYRAVIVLCDLEGATRKEAARRLSCPEGTVGGRLARARAMLAERLTRRGVGSAAGLLAAVLSERTATAVPPALLAAVVRAVGVDDLAGAAAQGLISPRVAHTTEGVLKAMSATKLRTIAATVLCCGLALACGVGAVHLANAQPQPDPKTKTDPFDTGKGDKALVERIKPADAEKKLLCVIPLKTLDAKATAEKLAKLLPNAVTVAAVRDENALVVYATAKGTDDVRLVLRTLGEELPKEAPLPAMPKVFKVKAKTYTFRMKNVPWSDVLDWYSKESGLTMITTVKPTGRFTCDPPEGAEFTLAEITDLINEAMTQQKFILIRRKMTFFIHPLDEKLDIYYPRVELNELPDLGRTELVEVQSPLTNLDAGDVKDELRKLLTPFGEVVFAKGKTLIVRDTVGNLRRIRETLELCDKPAAPKSDPLDPRKPAGALKTYSIKFDKAPWKDVFTWYAFESGLTRVGDELPTGTFTFDSLVTAVPKPLVRMYTLDEITDHINEALLKQNWLLVRNDKSFAVVPADEKLDPKFVTSTTFDNLDKHGKYALVEVTAPFRKRASDDLVQELRTRLSPFGEIRVPETDKIVIRDLAGNLRTIATAYPDQFPIAPRPAERK